METVDITAQVREEKGSRQSRRLRRQGRLPVNLYGHGGSALPLHVDMKEFSDALRHHARILNLRFDGSSQPVVIHDVQHDPISQDVVHVDFLRVSLKEQVEVEVPIRLHGPAAGEKDGGVVQEHHDRVLVRCLPLEIPEEIVVDIRPLGVHGLVHAREVALPARVELADAPDKVLVSVAEPRFRAEVVEEAAPTEPEVIGKPTDEEPETPDA